MFDVENVCISLIYCEKPEVAMLIYESFIKSSSDSDYATSLIKEMLNCGVVSYCIQCVKYGLICFLSSYHNCC